MSRHDVADLRDDRYGRLSRQPLHALAFVLPPLVLFHVSLLWAPDVLMAHRHVGQIMQFFGVTGPLMPAIAIPAVLLIQHALSHRRWRIRPLVPLVMAAESILWALPLLALLQILGPLSAANGQPPTYARTMVSLGAGIYEEFVFRLVLIELLVLLLVDVLNGPKTAMTVAAAVVSAVAFSLYHPQAWQDGHFGSALLWGPFAFRALAGGYLAAIFVLRGFGIVVGAHALYNVTVMLVFA